MIYPANFEVKSGFASIRNYLHQHCLVEYSHNLVESIAFQTDTSILRMLLSETAEMKYVLQFITGFPQQDYYDLSSELTRIKVKGTFVEPETLLELKLSLETITSIISFIQNLDQSQFPYLRMKLPNTLPDRKIVEYINKITDEKGEIRDKASEKLFEIRKELKSRASTVNHRIHQILIQARKDNIIDDNTELTLRNGRLVIPVPSGNKRKIRGYVHDTSATGQTVFIEPSEVFDINNDIQNLRVEEKQEIIHILIQFTDFLRAYQDELFAYYRFLGEIDFVRAKALFAIDINAVSPLLLDNPSFEWYSAVHPLLQKTLKKQGKSIVPQDISLNSDKRIMVISGPNAGGKSVSLKTVALLQYMFQCGLLIPVSDDSKSGIFSKIFLEIGDEQSLENDLSTYSSHLMHIRHFLEHADNATLFLIDEFGSGTEPQLGGAMAEASLQELNRKQAFGIVTTHYSNLKLLADKEEGIFNAAMLYDTKAMHPLFKLSIGKPGSSFAFEIANKIGFPKKVLEEATSKIGSSQLDFEKQLAQLEVDKKEIASKIAELKVADETLASLVIRYEKLFTELDSKKQNVLKDAKSQAGQIIRNSNKLIEKTIREIKEKQAEKEATKLIREDFTKAAEEILTGDQDVDQKITESSVMVSSERSIKRPAFTKLEKGSYVKMEGQENIGIVENLKGNKVHVAFGSFNMRTTTDKLEVATTEEIKRYQSIKHYGLRSASIVNDLKDKMADFKMSIDLRGKKPDEALTDLNRYIDQAILLRVHEVRILHGKGNGVLRNLVHQVLNDIPEVTKLEDEKLDHGGHGITVVYLE